MAIEVVGENPFADGNRILLAQVGEAVGVKGRLIGFNDKFKNEVLFLRIIEFCMLVLNRIGNRDPQRLQNDLFNLFLIFLAFNNLFEERMSRFTWRIY